MKICLVMIVKNEAHIIRRALDSLHALVDYAIVCDTGSNPAEFDQMSSILCDWGDDTGIEWQFHSEPWKDFAHNRTVAMRIAEQQFPDATHLLMLDADDYVETCPVFGLSDADAFKVRVRSGGLEYPRVQLFKADGSWRYRGVVHEFPEHSSGTPHVEMAPLVVRSTREGARSLVPHKYGLDAELLYAALNNPNCEADLIPRYQFYLAQSYENDTDLKRAERWYRERMNNEAGYPEERYLSAYRLAQIEYGQHKGPLSVEYLCRAAQDICPWRREAARFAMKALNEAGMYARAMTIWREWPGIGANTITGLFIEPDVYAWRYFEEIGIAAHYCEQYGLSARMFVKALNGLPNKTLDMARIASNLVFPTDKL